MASREWREANKERLRVAIKTWYETNKGQIRERRRAKRVANRESERARIRAWVDKNRERFNETRRSRRSRNPDLANAYHKSWRDVHPEKIRALRHTRRARKRGAEGHYVVGDLHAILEEQALSCYCGVSFLVTPPTVDHIIPLSRGGSNWPSNLQLLCQPCNDSKGAKTMKEWAGAV